MSQIQGELAVDVNQAKASLNNTLKEKDNELQETLKKAKELQKMKDNDIVKFEK